MPATKNSLHHTVVETVTKELPCTKRRTPSRASAPVTSITSGFAVAISATRSSAACHSRISSSFIFWARTLPHYSMRWSMRCWSALWNTG